MLDKIRDQPQLSLALARYQQQFVAVRDRSDGHDSVFAFKRGLSILINPYSERRWAQPSHTALAYGEIKTVYHMPEAGAFCIVLTCPMNASCDAIYMFVRQLWSLKRILDLDMLESPGAIAVSWFDRSQQDPRMRRRTGSFYVTLRSENEAEASEYEQMFITSNPVGKIFECLLGFQRRHIGTSNVISKAGRMALSTVEYGRDFAAVREGSYPGGSEFYFAEEKDVSTESEVQDGLGLRINILVGEIDRVSGVATCSLGPSCDVICVKIRPPSDTNCEGHNAYRNQLEQLRKIIGVDYYNGSTQPVGGSWFDASRDFKGWGPEENCFYVFVRDTRDDRTKRLKSLKAGTCVAFCGTMSRLDEDAENTRNYYIWALEFLPGQFPSRREGDNRSRIMTSLLATIRTLGIRALAFAKYEEDFFATRESSCEGHDFYTFKAIGEGLEPRSERREECPSFSPVLFGEILAVYEMGEDQLGMTLGCPEGATCSARDVFMKQVATLDNILSVDSINFHDLTQRTPECRMVPPLVLISPAASVAFLSEADLTLLSRTVTLVSVKRTARMMGTLGYSRFGDSICGEEDWPEPPLSVYNYAAVRILEGRPYDEHWRAVLSTMNVVSLYRLSLTSRASFSVVMAHVRAAQPPSGSVDESEDFSVDIMDRQLTTILGIYPDLAGGPSDSLSQLPVELFGLILPNLNRTDRTALSLASRKFSALVCRELQAGVNRVLARFGLCHAEIRFMQSATMTVICGQCISHLLDYNVQPETLEFRSPKVTYHSVLRFFAFSTGCDGFPALFNNLNIPEGYNDSTKFAGSPTSTNFIRVARSITNSALDGVTYSPFSHLFGAVTHYGVWFAYPETSMTNVTLPNKNCIDFDDPRTEDRVIRNIVAGSLGNAQ
ncbi:hypothetical protein C8F04DRAFT_1276711 [Mycena alexandri]|uniref:F-box domain-containing protein n=1 Tax=Mycena alexandri TaxID=1745969 RepID=A0AAD6S243_9AGAR|nr:hypothetical protein C8F04DRAFT_1276711 [Mycena alexandri]